MVGFERTPYIMVSMSKKVSMDSLYRHLSTSSVHLHAISDKSDDIKQAMAVVF